MGFISAVLTRMVKMLESRPFSMASLWRSYILPTLVQGVEMERVRWSCHSRYSSGCMDFIWSALIHSPARVSAWWKFKVDGVAAAYTSSEVLPFSDRKWANSSSARKTEEGPRTLEVVQLWTAANLVRKECVPSTPMSTTLLFSPVSSILVILDQ